MQSARHIGAHLDTRTYFRESGSTLKNQRLGTGLATCQCGSEPTNSTTHNDHRIFHKLDFATI